MTSNAWTGWKGIGTIWMGRLDEECWEWYEHRIWQKSGYACIRVNTSRVVKGKYNCKNYINSKRSQSCFWFQKIRSPGTLRAMKFFKYYVISIFQGCTSINHCKDVGLSKTWICNTTFIPLFFHPWAGVFLKCWNSWPSAYFTMM